MKTMKNVLMILLGAALVLSLAGVGAVAADDTTDTFKKWDDGEYRWGEGDDGEITVSYTIGVSYSLTIPADVDLNTAISPNLNVQATLNPSDTLIVNVTSVNGWCMEFTDNNANKYSIPYTLTIENSKVSKDGEKGQVVLHRLTKSTVSSGVNLPMAFETSIDDQTSQTSLPAGKYTDTLRFTVTYTEATENTPADSTATEDTPADSTATEDTPADPAE